jgi:ethanolamine utilization protein EutN
MFVGKVVGRIWATRKHPSLVGLKLLLVCRYDFSTGTPAGLPQMAVDQAIDAGMGDIVLVIDEGSSARQILNDAKAPIRTMIVGVVDTVTLGGRHLKFH